MAISGMQTIPVLRGAFYACSSGIFCALSGLAVKYLKTYNTIELTVFRFAAISVFALPSLVMCRNISSDPVCFKCSILKGVVSAFNIIFRYQAYKILPLGIANAIAFSNPVLVAILARIFLKEKLNRGSILSLITTVLGLCLIVKLPSILSSLEEPISAENGTFLIGFAYAMASLLCLSVGLVSIRRMSYVPESMQVFNLGWMSAAIAAFSSPWLGKITFLGECSKDAWILVSLGIFGYMTHFTLTRSLQNDSALSSTIVRMASDIVLSFILQVVVFGDPIEPYGGVGALLVCLAGCMLPVTKWLGSLPEDSPIRVKWQFLLK